MTNATTTARPIITATVTLVQPNAWNGQRTEVYVLATVGDESKLFGYKSLANPTLARLYAGLYRTFLPMATYEVK